MPGTFTRLKYLLVFAAITTLAGCQQEELLEDQFKPTENFIKEDVQAIEGQYIVVLKNSSGSLTANGVQHAVSGDHAPIAGVYEQVLQATAIDKANLKEKYEGAINGFAAKLSNEQVELLKKNPNVASVEQDKIIMLGRMNFESLFRKIFGHVQPAPTPTPAPNPTPADTTSQPVASTPAPQPTTPGTNAFKTITPLSGELVPWNISKIGYGDGTGKTVWIIDSGVDTDHPDLNIDLSKSKSFIYGENSFEDGYGHGTTVAGIVAAKNNGSGMIGVAANATIIALRVFDNEGKGTVSRAISAVNHVIKNAKAGDVVNISLGSGTSATLDNAVKTAAAKGLLFAIAAGNNGVDCEGMSPARVNAGNVYTVSAMDSFNRLWDKSNFGLSVDFAAPGVSVTSCTRNGGLGTGANGTSFAAPHVAGILLLRGTVFSQGTVIGDKDTVADQIASVK